MPSGKVKWFNAKKVTVLLLILVEERHISSYPR